MPLIFLISTSYTKEGGRKAQREEEGWREKEGGIYMYMYIRVELVHKHVYTYMYTLQIADQHITKSLEDVPQLIHTDILGNITNKQ